MQNENVDDVDDNDVLGVSVDVVLDVNVEVSDEVGIHLDVNVEVILEDDVDE